MNYLDWCSAFIRTNNKKPVKQLSDKASWLSFDRAMQFTEFAGILEAGIVVVDVDEIERAERVLQIVKALNIQCVVIVTTRGMHFIFKSAKAIKCISKVLSACGIAVDYKCGNGETVYEVLKLDGNLREIIYDAGIGELPTFLYPTNKRCKSFDDDLFALEAGARNDALFSHVRLLQKCGISKEDIRYTIRDIANQYVIKEPLSDSELDSTVLRDDLFEDNKPLSNRAIAEKIIENFHAIKLDNQTYIYHENRYVHAAHIIDKAILSYVPLSSKHQRNEIKDLLLILAPDKAESDKRYILFKNGVYDVITGQLLPHSHEYIITNLIPHNYNPEAYCEKTEAAIYDWCCGYDDIFDLLEEFFGYCMYRSNPFRKAALYTGNKNNGKSTCLNMLCAFYGDENTSHVALENIDMRFQSAQLYKKLVNIGDDVESNKVITHNAIFKKIVSGDTINAERKGENHFSFKPYTKLIYSANSIPYIIDDTGAVRDRLLIIPFNAHFDDDPEKKNVSIIDDLTTEASMEYIARIGIEGLQRLLKNKRFTIPECVKDAMKQYTIESNPIAAFVSENKESIIGTGTNIVYQRFEMFCQDNEIEKHFSPKHFNECVVKLLQCKIQPRKNERGESVRCFVRL